MLFRVTTPFGVTTPVSNLSSQGRNEYDLAQFTDERVRQALNYLVPREQILKAVYFDTARLTKSPISEIYPGYTDKYFIYGSTEDGPKAIRLLPGDPALVLLGNMATPVSIAALRRGSASTAA